MKSLFSGFLTGISMFTVFPVPSKWDTSAFCWVVPTFPFVRLIIGALWYGFSLLLARTALPLPLTAALLLLFPLFLSGFIHVDGYMDTCDAVFSRAELLKKREILKDPCAGAFAVIALGVYMVLGYSAIHTMFERGADLRVFVFIPALSGSVAGVALLNVAPISESGFGADFSRGAKAVHKLIPLCAGILCAVCGYWVGGVRILVPLTALALGGALAALYSVRQLGGISGDLCGFIITVSELCALLAAGGGVK